MTTGVDSKLTPQREALSLYHHGTVKWNLTPNVVYQTAVRDLQSLDFNTWLRGERSRTRETHGKDNPAYKTLPPHRGYGFLAKHVRKATTPAALLELALDDRTEGLVRARNVNTLALYDNGDTLAKAYALALGSGT